MQGQKDTLLAHSGHSASLGSTERRRMEAAGIEPATDPCISKDLQQSIDQKARKSAASGANSKQIPPELHSVIEAWPDVPEHIRAAIKALVQTHNAEDK